MIGSLVCTLKQNRLKHFLKQKSTKVIQNGLLKQKWAVFQLNSFMYKKTAANLHGLCINPCSITTVFFDLQHQRHFESTSHWLLYNYDLCFSFPFLSYAADIDGSEKSWSTLDCCKLYIIQSLCNLSHKPDEGQNSI